MQKASNLRDYLAARVTGLKKHPEKFHVFIEKGSIRCRPVGNSFRYHYTVSLLIEDFTEHVDHVAIPLLQWVAVNQFDLLQNPEKQENGITFEAELLDNNKADLMITLPLTESVRVEQVDNKLQATHLEEPPQPDLSGPTVWTLEAPGLEAAP